VHGHLPGAASPDDGRDGGAAEPASSTANGAEDAERDAETPRLQKR